MLPSTLNFFRQSSLCLALTAAGLTASVSVQAQTVHGADATATGTNSTATGDGSTATGDYSTATGMTSKAIGMYSTATGENSEAMGSNSTATGMTSKALGVNSTAVGANSRAGWDKDNGYYGGDNSTAIGESSTANGEYSTATGVRSKASGDYSTATGVLSKASGDNSTATGANSQAIGDKSTANGYLATAGSLTQVCPVGLVVTADPYLCSADGTGSSGDPGVMSKVYSGVGAIAIGAESAAAAHGSIAMGANSSVVIDAIDSIAIGRGAKVELGAFNAIAIGGGSIATESNTFSVGSVSNQRRIVNVAAGTNETDAVNKKQLDAAIATVSGGAGGTGAKGDTGVQGVKGDTGVQGIPGAAGTTGLTGAAGTNGTNGTTILTGASGATMAQVSAVVNGAIVEHAVLGTGNAITLETGATTGSQVSMTLTNGIGNTHGIVIQEAQTVLSGGTHSTTLTLADNGATFANAQTGAAIVVSGVAAGVAATDAANVGQLTTAIDAAVAPLDARLMNVEGNIQRLDQKITDLENKLSGGIALATAFTQPVSFAPGAKNAVTGGIATYNGQSAVAFGFNRLVMSTTANRMIVSGGVGLTTSGQTAARVGASFSW